MLYNIEELAHRFRKTEEDIADALLELEELEEIDPSEYYRVNHLTGLLYYDEEILVVLRHYFQNNNKMLDERFEFVV